MKSVRAQVAVAAWLALVLAQAPVHGAEPDPLFSSDTMLELTLTAPFGDINRARDKEVEYDGKLQYTESDGTPREFDVKLQVRGNYRLRSDICLYSQLWVNVRKGQVEGTLFDKQDNIKLVTQCRNGAQHVDLIGVEQQAYLLYNRLTPLSLLTRAVNVTYVDSEDGDAVTHRAFFVEHPERLAARFDMEDAEVVAPAVAQLDPVHSSLVDLFMMMIGNTDYSLTTGEPGEECCHNAKLLLDANGVLIPVPYDFDASGLVDAPYAAPPPEFLRISNNRQRKFRGFCAHVEQVPGAIANMLAAKGALLEIVTDTTWVREGTARDSTRFLEGFFRILEDERLLQREIVGDCRG